VRVLLRYAAFIMRLSVMAITETNIISCDKVYSAALSTTETDVKRRKAKSTSSQKRSLLGSRERQAWMFRRKYGHEMDRSKSL
jgi:hypothetical protein